MRNRDWIGEQQNRMVRSDDGMLGRHTAVLDVERTFGTTGGLWCPVMDSYGLAEQYMIKDIIIYSLGRDICVPVGTRWHGVGCEY